MNIALRTRSKLPLTDTSIDAIESSFTAPDFTPDMYATYCDDADWMKFLTGLTKDDGQYFNHINIFSSFHLFRLWFFFNNFCDKAYIPREPWRDPSNRRLNEHGIYIRHCQESNSQPVPPKCEPIPLGHSDGLLVFRILVSNTRFSHVPVCSLCEMNHFD